MKTTDLYKALGALGALGVLILLLTGCTGLPTVAAPTPNAELGTVAPLPTATPNVPLVTVTGDVFIRDAQGGAQGYLIKGTTVYTFCSGEWCYLDGGLKFWRGCSSDNPYKLGCTAK